jgi:hypothetical protein
LGEFTQLKSQVLAQARGLKEAAHVLTRMAELRDGLLHTEGTLGEIQHLLVDMVLLEPAVKRAQLSLQPVVEITRISRQIESAMTPEKGPEKVSNDSEGDSAVIDQVGNKRALAAWSEMVASVVAWCQQTR